jgi:acyl carrier protein
VAAEGARLRHVTLCAATADALPLAAAGRFDLAVLNSVVQYFPSFSYLLAVLRQAASLLRPGGAIFLGDLRSLPLLPALRASVLLRQAPDGLVLDELRRQLHEQVAGERELVLDPRIFAGLVRRLPGIDRFTVQLRRGRCHNELTKYRFDAILSAASATPCTGRQEAAGAPDTTLDWQEERLSLPELAQRARETLAAGRSLRVLHIPNARLAEDVELLRLLARGEGEEPATVGELRRALGAVPPAAHAVDPQTLWDLEGPLAASVLVCGSDSAATGCFDVIFRPRPAGLVANAALGEALPRDGEAAAESLERYANRPQSAPPGRELVLAKIGELLRSKLPSFMLPSAYVVLDAMPRTPNGKGARRALPAPPGASSRGADFIPPRTGVESMLAGLWSQVLGVERVGVHDDFFALGGHSLLATQLLARVHGAFQVEIPLRRLFEARTVAALAQVVVAEEARPGHSEAVAQLLEKVRNLSPGELHWELETRQTVGGTV